jgi:hypothetical protein
LKRVKHKKRNVNSSKSSKPVFYRFFIRIIEKYFIDLVLQYIELIGNGKRGKKKKRG